jgi:hypothetical protein
MFFKNVNRVLNIALRKQLPSAHGLTLSEAASAVYLFLEWATLNATLGKHVTQCFWAFTDCPGTHRLQAFPLWFVIFHLPIQVTKCYKPCVPPANRAFRWVGQQHDLQFCMGHELASSHMSYLSSQGQIRY